jgi:thiol-disulfide isomerase/thioredoxin
MIDRRTAAAGLGLFAANPALADEPQKKPSPIAHGILADNSLAQIFEPVDNDLPSVYLWTLDDKKKHIDELKGRTLIMPLWAEWCAPCMSELPDFARLQRKYGNDKFAIVPVLTGTQKKFTPELLGKILGLMHCDVFEPLIESNRGDRLIQKMARRGNEVAIPCNLLITPDLKVMAREIGRLANSDDADPAKSWKDTLNRTGVEGSVQSRWGQADGEAFVKAMSEGFLA